MPPRIYAVHKSWKRSWAVKIPQFPILKSTEIGRYFHVNVQSFSRTVFFSWLALPRRHSGSPPQPQLVGPLRCRKSCGSCDHMWPRSRLENLLDRQWSIAMLHSNVVARWSQDSQEYGFPASHVHWYTHEKELPLWPCQETVVQLRNGVPTPPVGLFREANFWQQPRLSLSNLWQA